MQPVVLFRPLKLSSPVQNGAKSEGPSTSLRDEFFATLMDCERSIQQKIRSYDSDSAVRLQQNMQSLHSKEAQQSALLKKFDADAKMEKEWNAIVQSTKMFVQSNESLPPSVKQLIASSFTYAKSKDKSVASIANAFQKSLLSLKDIDLQSLQDITVFLQEMQIAVLPEVLDTIQRCNAFLKDVSALFSQSYDLLKEPKRSHLPQLETLQASLSQALSSPMLHYTPSIREDVRQLSARVTHHMEIILERIQQEDQNTKAAQEANQVKLALFPFLKTFEQQRQDFRSYLLEQRGQLSACSPDMIPGLSKLLSLLHHPNQLAQYDSSHPQTDPVPSSSTDSKLAVKVPLKSITKYVSDVVRVFQQEARHGVLAMHLLEAVVHAVKGVDSEYTIQLYAAVVAGVLYALPPAHKKLWTKMLLAMLSTGCEWVQPNLLIPSSSSSSSSSSTSSSSHALPVYTTNERMNLFRLFACWLSYTHDHRHQDPYQAEAAGFACFSTDLAWKWLVHFFHQWTYLAHCQVSHASTSSSRPGGASSPSLSCLLLHTFLKYNAHGLYLSQQDSFAQLLTHCLQVSKLLASSASASLPPASLASNPLDKCVEMLHKLCTERTAVGYHLNHQAPYVLSGLLLARISEEIHQQVSVMEQDKASPFMTRVKTLQLDRLRVIFNRLSVTKESQQQAIQQLGEKMVHAMQEGPEMVKYLLVKIVSNILRDCQEEFFNEMDEGQPLRLAKLMVGLCQDMQALREYLLESFYRTCPVLIPSIVPEGLGGTAQDTYLAALGFVKKPGQDGWEGQDAWLARMSKILAVFTVTAIQPEQSPFTISQVYVYLTRLVNVYCLMPTPPFFAATFVEVVLRIAGKRLAETYGQIFIKVLRMVQEHILPKLDDKMPRKKSLETFLQRFIASNGRDFMSLFHKSDE